jgi:hypothetical protein
LEEYSLESIGKIETERAGRMEPRSFFIPTTSRNHSNVLRQRDVESLRKIEGEHHGQIATFKDPDGYLLELWQPS